MQNQTVISITTDELALLAYLHEHATGYTPADVIERQAMKKLVTDLNLTDAEFRKQATYLASFGIVGVWEQIFRHSMGTSAEITSVGITGAGASYMRQLELAMMEKEPGRWSKFSAATIKASGGVIVAVATKLLVDSVSSNVSALAKAITSHNQ